MLRKDYGYLCTTIKLLTEEIFELKVKIKSDEVCKKIADLEAKIQQKEAVVKELNEKLEPKRRKVYFYRKKLQNGEDPSPRTTTRNYHVSR